MNVITVREQDPVAAKERKVRETACETGQSFRAGGGAPVKKRQW